MPCDGLEVGVAEAGVHRGRLRTCQGCPQQSKKHQGVLRGIEQVADRVVALCTGEEVDGSIKVTLGYDAVVELWSEEMLCACAGVESCLQPNERRDLDRRWLLLHAVLSRERRFGLTPS